MTKLQKLNHVCMRRSHKWGGVNKSPTCFKSTLVHKDKGSFEYRKRFWPLKKSFSTKEYPTIFPLHTRRVSKNLYLAEMIHSWFFTWSIRLESIPIWSWTCNYWLVATFLCDIICCKSMLLTKCACNWRLSTDCLYDMQTESSPPQ